MWTKILINCGCAGESGHRQKWDEYPLEGEKVVWRCSVPHGPEWLAPHRLIFGAREQGYSVHAIITVRDWFAMANSQVSAKHVGDITEANLDIEQAYRVIFQSVTVFGVPFIVVIYNRSGDEKYRSAMLGLIGLKENQPITFEDANAKYYVAQTNEKESP